jgi:MFS family permease
MKTQHLLHNVWKLDSYMFLSGFHLFSAVIITLLTGWGGLTLTQALLLQSWFTLAIFLLEVPTGVVADVWGRKQSLILGAFVSVIGFIVYALVPNFWIFALGEFLLALAFTLRSGAAEALLYDSVPQAQAKKALSKNTSLTLVALSVGPALGSILLNWVEPQHLMMLTAVPFLIMTILAFTLEEPTKVEHQDQSQQFWATLFDGIKFFMRHPQLRSLAVDMGIVAGVSKMMIWLYQPLLQEQGVSESLFGVFFAIAVAIEVVAMNSYAHLESKGKSVRKILFWSGLIPALGLLLAGFSQVWWLSVLGMWLTIGIGMSRKPFFAGIFNEHISSKQRATVLSAIAMSSQIMLVFLNPIVGVIGDWSVQGALVGLGIVLGIFVIGKHVKKTEILRQIISV